MQTRQGPSTKNGGSVGPMRTDVDGGSEAMRTSAKPLIIRAKFGRNLIIYGVKTALFLRVKHAILFLKSDSNVKVYAMDGVLWTSCPDSRTPEVQSRL